MPRRRFDIPATELATWRPRNHALIPFKDVKGIKDGRAAARATFAHIPQSMSRARYIAKIRQMRTSSENREIPQIRLRTLREAPIPVPSAPLAKLDAAGEVSVGGASRSDQRALAGPALWAQVLPESGHY